MGYLGATLTLVFTRTRRRSGRVTQRCHNSPRWETGIQSVDDVTHRKRGEDFGRFWKSQFVELRPASAEDGWLSLAREALWRVRHDMGGRWKGQNRKIEPLSPYVEKPLNSKVIKSFVPELKSRVFRVSRSLCSMCIYIYIYIYEHTFREFMYIGHGTGRATIQQMEYRPSWVI